jgi:hypothetical protein
MLPTEDSRHGLLVQQDTPRTYPGRGVNRPLRSGPSKALRLRDGCQKGVLHHLGHQEENPGSTEKQDHRHRRPRFSHSAQEQGLRAVIRLVPKPGIGLDGDESRPHLGRSGLQLRWDGSPFFFGSSPKRVGKKTRLMASKPLGFKGFPAFSQGE